MKIFIRQIRPEGIEREEQFAADWAGLTGKDNVRFIAPVKVKAAVTRVDDEIFMKITAGSRYESFCYRCLEVLEQDWASDFRIVFDITKPMEFIEPDEDIRQELVLRLPARVLCREDCKGLCVECGANLNNEQCRCVVSGQKKVKI